VTLRFEGREGSWWINKSQRRGLAPRSGSATDRLGPAVSCVEPVRH
jgi:hypothetical protein